MFNTVYTLFARERKSSPMPENNELVKMLRNVISEEMQTFRQEFRSIVQEELKPVHQELNQVNSASTR